jgi:class 3 adenylate cyclase
VIGTDIIRYDLFGVDVLIANKMESNGEPGRVMISEECKHLLDENYAKEFVFTFNTDVFVPAANKYVKSYFVEFSHLN